MSSPPITGELPLDYLRNVQRRVWLDRYRQGATCAEIANEYKANPETVRRHIRKHIDDNAEIERLDRIGHTRALTEVESILLERMIWRVDRGSRKRARWGENKELARAGIGRRR